MLARIDIAGRRFGRLVVICPKYNNKNMWFCRCDCSKIGGHYYEIKSLLNGWVKSCGCIYAYPLKGQRRGRLKILYRVGKDLESKDYVWKCQCDCGNIVFKYERNIKVPYTSSNSCGCLLYAQYFVRGTHIDHLNVPFEITRCMQAKGKLKKAIKQAS